MFYDRTGRCHRDNGKFCASRGGNRSGRGYRAARKHPQCRNRRTGCYMRTRKGCRF